MILYFLLLAVAGEKRQAEDYTAPEDVKRHKIDGDVSSDTVAEIVANISDPARMLGPEVSLTMSQDLWM